MVEKLFRLREHGTTPSAEIRAGFVTFLTLSYILFVNPQILSETGMPAADVAVATALAGALATFVMAVFANYPIALAPGMGLNAYFTYGVVLGLGVDWRVALAAVFVEGVLFLILSLTGVRSALLRAIPAQLKIAIMGGIGLFLAVIGMANAGLIVDHPATLVALGDVSSAPVALTLIGVLCIAALSARRVPGALLIGVLTVSVAAWLLGLAPGPDGFLTTPALPSETLFALDFAGLLSGKVVTVVLAFLFVDLFDTAGTLIGVGRLAGLVDEDGELERADRAFAADAAGTIAGSLLGTSTVTSYVESATGIEEGGRTGLTALTVSMLFLLSLFFTPVLIAIPAVATAPALIVVGALMMRGVADLDWARVDEAVPAFLTVAAMPMTYSIANGVSLGIVSYVGIKLLAGRGRSVPLPLWLLAAALVAYYATGLG